MPDLLFQCCHVLRNSRHDPKPLRCEQFSDSYNKPFLSSAGRKNRQTLKLQIHFQWIIWLPVTFVWHNLHAIHKLILSLMLQNQQIYNKQNLPHKPCRKKAFRAVASVYWFGCMSQAAATYTWRLLLQGMPASSAWAQGAHGIPRSPRTEIPKPLTPQGTALGSELKDPVCCIQQSLATFPISMSQSPYSIHTLCIGPWPKLTTPSLASIWGLWSSI